MLIGYMLVWFIPLILQLALRWAFFRVEDSVNYKLAVASMGSVAVWVSAAAFTLVRCSTLAFLSWAFTPVAGAALFVIELVVDYVQLTRTCSFRGGKA